MARIRTAVILSLIFANTVASAAPKAKERAPTQSRFERIKCHDVVEKKLIELGCQGEWSQPAKRWDTFRSPTTNFGHWVEMRLNKADEAVIDFISARQIVSWKFDSCQPSSENRAGMDLKAKSTAAKYMDDSQLSEILKAKSNGLIYAWSPVKLESVQKYKAVEKMAKELGLHFLPLADWRADLNGFKPGQFRSFLTQPTIHAGSIEIALRVGQNFPMLIPFKNGKLIAPVEFEYRPFDAIKMSLANIFQIGQ